MRAAGLLRRAKLVYGEDGTPEPYDKLIIATGSRAFIPPMEGVTMPDGSFKPGVFVFRTLDDCREIAEYAKGQKTRRGDRRRPAGPRSRTRPAELRARGERGSPRRPPDAAAARRRRGRAF